MTIASALVLVVEAAFITSSGVRLEADQSRLKPAPTGYETQLVVAAAVPDPSGQTVTITGSRFGTRPFVTLNLIPLTVQFAIDTHIVAAAPISMMPPGTYLLTVSRGPSPADNASIDVALGGAGPTPDLPPSRSSASASPAEARAGASASGGGKVGPTPDSPAATPSVAAPSSVGPSFSSGAAVPMPDLKVGPTPDSPAATPSVAAPSSVGPSFSSGDAVAAKVGDRVITVAELDREWQRVDPASYMGVSRRMYDIRRQVADKLVADELLAREAAARGVTTEALLNEEIPKRTIEMPESAVVSLYQGLGDTTRGATLDQMRPALRAWLKRFTEPEIAKMNYIEELMKVSTRADVFLVPPRVNVERAGQDVELGPATAPVEIVAFGDLRNGRYAAFAQAFGRVRDTFGDRVRFVFKHLPALGPESVAAAEAAQCAHAQGRFWAFHDALLAQGGALGVTRLQEAATKAGLDRGAFDACVERGESRGVIRQALDEAGRYGIHEPASFLINGRLVPDPPPFLPPFEFFQRIIEDELLTLGKKR